MVRVEIRLLGELLATPAKQSDEDNRGHGGEHNGDVVAEAEADRCALQVLGAHPQDIVAGDEGHEQARDEGYPEVLLFAAEVDHGNAKAAHGHELVAPAEVVPKDVEAFGVQVAPEDDGRAEREHRDRQNQAVLDGGLVHTGEFGNREAETAQARVATGNRKDNDAHDDEDGNRCERDNRRDKFAQDFHTACTRDEFRHVMVDEHAAGGPDHADEAFDDHHAVEGLAAGMFGLFGAGDERALCAVESADDAAGNRHEQHRNDRLSGLARQ